MTMTGLEQSSEVRPSEWWPAEWGPTPRYATRRTPGMATWGPNAGTMARKLGKPFYPFQQYVADVALEVWPDGSRRYQEVYFLAPRRTGKTFMEQAVVATEAETRPSYIVMTAQTRDKAKDRWKDVCSNPMTSGYNVNPFMAKRVKVTTGTGNERCVFLSTGSVFTPFSPNEDAGHGDQIDQVWIDELWTFDLKERDEIQTGYEPSGLIGDLQVWHLSAAGTSRSAWLKEAREIGRAATQDLDSRIAYFEWGMDPELADLEGDELADAIVDAHPRRDHGMRSAFLRRQVATRSKARVLRDYANIDADDGVGQMCVPEASWTARMSKVRIPFGSQVCVGVAQDDELREATVAVGWRRPDGVVQTDTVVSRPGVRWAESYVASMPDVTAVAVVYAKLGRRLASVVEQYEDGPVVLRVSGPDMVAGCQDWLAAMTETVTADGAPEGLAHDGSRELRDGLTHAEMTARFGLRSGDGEPVTAVAAHILARLAVLGAPQAEAPPAPFRIF